MAFYLKQAETVADGIRRICSEQTDRLIAEIEQPDRDNDKTIHQIRKRCKKIRGVLRLVREDSEAVYRSENDYFRDIARELSIFRDASVYPETYDKLIDHYSDHVDRRMLAPVRASLTRRRERFFRNDPLAARLADVRQRAAEARSRIADWPLRAGYDFDRIEGGLHKTYRRGRSAMRQASACLLGARFYAEKPKHFCRRFANYWQAWRA